MEIQKTTFMVSRTARPRIDGIVQQVRFGPNDCDGHGSAFTYKYTGLETTKMHPYSHSTEVESWSIGSGKDRCTITNQEGNKVEYTCQLNNIEEYAACQEGQIEHFGGAGFRLILYATMKPVVAPKPPEPPEPQPEPQPLPEPAPQPVPLEFVKSSRSSVYHRLSCYYVKIMKHKAPPFSSLDGLRPCRRCRPEMERG